jgi:hypothetical protein
MVFLPVLPQHLIYYVDAKLYSIINLDVRSSLNKIDLSFGQQYDEGTNNLYEAYSLIYIDQLIYESKILLPM